MKKKKREEILEILEGLTEMLEKKVGKIPKPEFKIYMKSDEEGEGFEIEVYGDKPSLCMALAELTTQLLEKSNLTKDDIIEAIEAGIEEYEQEEE